MTPPPQASRLLPATAAAAVGLGWCVLLVGAHTLDPRNTAWTLQGDWAMAQLSQSFFRDAPWGWPLGTVPGYLHPMGASLSSADGIPWLGLLARPWAPLLPRGFQLLGGWLVLCFALQGALGALLTARFTAGRFNQFLGGVLFLLMPILSTRMGHLSLCGHWLLVGMVWLCLGAPREPRTVRRTLLLGLLFVLLATGIHPYLCAMVLTLGFALVLQVRIPGEGPRAALAWAGLYLTVAISGLASFGYLGTAGYAPGFHGYSANLLTFFNSAGHSLLLPSLPVGPGQYEGYGYLGAGVLSLGAFGLLCWRLGGKPPPEGSGRRWRAAAPLLTACLLMGLFSLSGRLMLGPWQLISFTRLYDAVLGPVTGAFRAPGRFIWPLAYLCVAGVLALLFHVLGQRSRLATAVLGAAVLVQAAELRRGGGLGPPAVRPLRSAAWAQAGVGFSHLVLYPPVLQDGAGQGCLQEGFSRDESALLAHEAHRQGLTVNSGYVARLRAPEAMSYCQRLEAEVSSGVLDPRSVYVVHPSAASTFLARPGGGASCGRVDGHLVCISTDSAAGGLRALLAGSPGT